MVVPMDFAALRQQSPWILPSMLLCDFGNLEREIRQLEEAGAPGLHLDVMDGVFVPNMTYGMPIVEACRKLTSLPLDVHLMIAKPEQYAEAFVDAGASVVTFHAEAVDDARPTLEKIKAKGAGAGVVINPETAVAEIEPVLELCDVVLVMSVKAGFGGQSFQPQVLEKVGQIRSQSKPEMIVAMDGGINDATIGDCAAAGTDWFVVGSGIFRSQKHGSDYRSALSELTQLAKSGAEQE